MHGRIRKHLRMIACGLAAVTMCIAVDSASAAQKEPKKSKAPACVSDRDIAALNARVLQTELMVAALSCDERQRYNTFVSTYQSVLVDRGKALQALFKRAHGAQGGTRLNAFITKMANDSSHEIRAKGDEYCVFASELFDEALANRPEDLNRLASKPWISKRHGYPSCTASNAQQDRAG